MKLNEVVAVDPCVAAVAIGTFVTELVVIVPGVREPQGVTRNVAQVDQKISCNARFPLNICRCRHPFSFGAHWPLNGDFFATPLAERRRDCHQPSNRTLGRGHVIFCLFPSKFIRHPVLGRRFFPVDSAIIRRWSVGRLVVHSISPDFLNGGGGRYRRLALSSRRKGGHGRVRIWTCRIFV
jgi:hypothetical protein